MIIKIYERIHSKYSKFFKFFFFLRYVFITFLIAFLLFFSIPKFFNYEKKLEIIKEHLVNDYELEINDYSSIEFNIFPLPNLSLKNTNFTIKKTPISFVTKNFYIFLNLKNIYNYENFVARKILLKDNKITLNIDKAKDILNYFKRLKSKLDIKELNVNLNKEEKSIVEIKKINFSNYGFKKNKIKGEIFRKKFKIFLDDSKSLDLKILDTGIKADFKFDETIKTDSTSGSSKITVLDNFLKFNFIIKDGQAKIMKANLRNKGLSLSFESLIKFKPFFEVNSDIQINKMDKKLLKNLTLEKIFENAEILKKLNSNNKVSYNMKKRPYGSLIKNYSSEFNLAHGRLIFSKKILIPAGEIACKGDSLLTEVYPRLNFNCFIDIENKKIFLKNFSIPNKINDNELRFNVIGSINLLNKKISFKSIKIHKNDTIKEEDINFFKETFERVLFDENFFGIFKKNKIRDFILELI